jgi:GlcNAc-P-P-Und epimerase
MTKVHLNNLQFQGKRFLITGGSGFIGAHLVDSLINETVEIINIDVEKPMKEAQISFWKECNILNKDLLFEIISKFQPTHIIHLAAEAKTDCPTIEDYQTNTLGTINLLEVIAKVDCVERIIITSSQHVRKPGSGLPENDQDFEPYKLYGESKVITEKVTREANLKCCWTIIRPTTIWGQGHIGLAEGLWSVINRGYYFHPKNDPVIRSYGYVKNVVYQINQILAAPEESVNRKVLYLGDACGKQSEWINGFSLQMTGKKIREIPKPLIYCIALAGELLDKIHIKFPLDMSRYRNMTTTNPVQMDKTFELLGPSPFSYEQGVKETLSWLKENNYIK